MLKKEPRMLSKKRILRLRERHWEIHKSVIPDTSGTIICSRTSRPKKSLLTGLSNLSRAM